MRRLFAIGGSCLFLLGWAPGAASCEGGAVIEAGTADAFALPSEPTSPSDRLVSYTRMFWPQPTTRWFDTGGNNAALIHTFEGWQTISGLSATGLPFATWLEHGDPGPRQSWS
jgi:hypothetical protein